MSVKERAMSQLLQDLSNVYENNVKVKYLFMKYIFRSEDTLDDIHNNHIQVKSHIEAEDEFILDQMFSSRPIPCILVRFEF